MTDQMNAGDRVRIGKGKTIWTVAHLNIPSGMVMLQREMPAPVIGMQNRRVERSRLTLVGRADQEGQR